MSGKSPINLRLRPDMTIAIYQDVKHKKLFLRLGPCMITFKRLSSVIYFVSQRIVSCVDFVGSSTLMAFL